MSACFGTRCRGVSRGGFREGVSRTPLPFSRAAVVFSALRGVVARCRRSWVLYLVMTASSFYLADRSGPRLRYGVLGRTLPSPSPPEQFSASRFRYSLGFTAPLFLAFSSLLATYAELPAAQGLRDTSSKVDAPHEACAPVLGRMRGRWQEYLPGPRLRAGRCSTQRGTGVPADTREFSLTTRGQNLTPPGSDASDLGVLRILPWIVAGGAFVDPDPQHPAPTCSPPVMHGPCVRFSPQTRSRVTVQARTTPLPSA